MTHLSVQISHLVSARPMSVTMGNAIRQLKLEISGSDIDLPEQDVCSTPLAPCITSNHSLCLTGEGCALWKN
jgi:translation initiation factor 2B subunit (eIF-2B alpha/beta/delta family)